MTDWKTIKIPANDYERHNAKRQNLGETWAEYISGQAPEGIDIEDIKQAMHEVLDEREGDDDFDTSGLMDAMNDSDGSDCPECGGELVYEMGSEDRQCVKCGWAENE